MSDSFLDNDSPEVDPKNDALGYSNFSEEVAKTITKINAVDGFVIAITGEWGSGKTTTLNYIEHFLTKESNKISSNNDDKPLILHFNPWLFSGHQDIVFQFFSQIYSEFTQKKFDIEKLRPIFEKLFEFGCLLATTSTPAGFFIGSTFTLLKGIAKKEEEKTIDKILKLRNELISLLRNQNITILVVIDDVDRLTANEIQDLFRSLKAVANFPKIIYLLAYDKDVVVEAFENQTIGCITNKGKGQEYLEKIVQLSLPLPPPKAAALDTFKRKNIGEALGEFDGIYYDISHWTWTDEGGINYFINTPRKVKRLANSLKILYPPVKNEVNVVDFIALEVLRQHQPLVYKKIRDEPHILLDDKAFFFGYTLNKPEELQKKYFATFLDGVSVEDKDAVIRIVINLFPDSRKYIDPESSHFHLESRDIKKARICSNIEIFRRYFRFELSDDDFSNQEIIGLLTQKHDSPSLLTYFHEKFYQKNPNGHSRFSSFLDMLKQFIDHSTPEPALITLINTLLTIDNQILTNYDNSPKMFGTQNNQDRIEIILYRSIEFITPDRRSSVVIDAFQNGTSLPLMTDFVGILGQQHGRNEGEGSSSPLISQDALNTLTEIWLQKIRSFSQDRVNFFSSPSLQTLIFVWRNVPDCEGEVSEYIQRFLTDRKTIIQSITESRKNNYIDPIQATSLLPYIEVIQFKEMIAEILQNADDLTDDEKKALEDFIK